jgi:hypothetical protein
LGIKYPRFGLIIVAKLILAKILPGGLGVFDLPPISGATQKKKNQLCALCASAVNTSKLLTALHQPLANRSTENASIESSVFPSTINSLTAFPVAAE